jgi:Tol biopolymer transport system component
MVIRERRWSGKAAIAASVAAAGIALVALAVVLLTGSGKTATPGANPEPSPAASRTPRVDYTLDLRTGVATPLPDAIVVSVAGFSRDPGRKYAAAPDGSRLAFVGLGDDENPQVFVARIDGLGIRQLTHDVREAMSPAWSPDGSKLAYVGYGAEWTGNARHLFVVDVATGVSRRVEVRTGNVWAPQFTADGSSILYTGGTTAAPVVRSVPVAGGRSTVFVEPNEGLTDTGDGSLSPDGSLVTFLGGGWPTKEGHHCGPCRFVANADGSDRRVLAGDCWGSSPAGTWSPDGHRIVCSDDVNGIVVADVVTGKTTRVAEGRSAIWLDRHTLLVDLA